jgi:hypothetical protein
MEPGGERQASRATDGAPREMFWAVWTVAAAFGCYFCMHAFRKPFTAASYADASFGGMDFKTVLVVSQVAGYMFAKILGVKIIAEMPPARRAAGIAWLILAAEAALVLFGLVPRPWNAACLFLNGIPLGMVFGLVLGTLEGRRLTEALAAGLCTSFIVADGVSKSVGSWLLARGVPEDWMPAAAGAVSLPAMGLCVFMLSRVPPPSVRDVAARAERSTMSRAERWSFLRRYAGGLVPILVMYLLVTVLRSWRADFAPEIWRGLGHPAQPATFTGSETLVAFGVLAVNGGAVLIRDNRRAFLASLATCGLGFGLLAFALLARDGVLDGFAFMVLLGLGLYLPYVAVHTTIFERLLAMTRDRGNVGFLMYVADSIGYLGYVAVMLSRNLVGAGGDLVGFLTVACWLTIGLSALCLLATWRYYAAVRPTPTGPTPPETVPARVSASKE